jgi:hypothetical protein
MLYAFLINIINNIGQAEALRVKSFKSNPEDGNDVFSLYMTWKPRMAINTSKCRATPAPKVDVCCATLRTADTSYYSIKERLVASV